MLLIVKMEQYEKVNLFDDNVSVSCWRLRARKRGIPYKTPSRHPFNPLRALRLSIALGSDIETVQKIFRSIWVTGNLPDEGSGWSAIQKKFKISI